MAGTDKRSDRKRARGGVPSWLRSVEDRMQARDDDDELPRVRRGGIKPGAEEEPVPADQPQMGFSFSMPSSDGTKASEAAGTDDKELDPDRKLAAEYGIEWPERGKDHDAPSASSRSSLNKVPSPDDPAVEVSIPGAPAPVPPSSAASSAHLAGSGEEAGTVASEGVKPSNEDGHDLDEPDEGPVCIDPEADIAELNRLERRFFAHRYVETGLDCFGASIDPPAATADRGEAMSILKQEDQELLCSDETGSLLERLSSPSGQEALNDVQKAQIRILSRDRAKLVGVPSEEQAALVRLCAEANDVWTKAKHDDDWAAFSPYLDRIVSTMKRIASFKNPDAPAYDVWLDEYEHGCDRAFYDSFFAEIKATVVPLLSAILEKGWQPSRHPIEGHYDEGRQWALASDLLGIEGLDPNSLFLTSTEHPYSDALGHSYGIIAAHVYPDDVCSNVFTMLHEGGHVLYEQGVRPELTYTCLKGGTSSGMHEGQSRFFENYVGRSKAFAPVLLKAMAKRFPGQMGRITARQLYLATNRAVPGPIRTEADELTYPLHILVRYEIEQELFEGSLKAADVPGAWASKYQQYLHVRVPSDREGALQDSHWSNGLFGYFPTYALGGAFGAQLRDRMIEEGMDFEAVLASGDLAPIRSWLQDRVWQWGRSKDSAQIIQDACGAPFSAKHFCEYLTKKYTEIYRL